MGPAAMTLEHDRRDALQEQDLLWAVVDLVQRCPGRPPQARLDAVLAGRALGPVWLVTLRPWPGNERRWAADASVPLS